MIGKFISVRKSKLRTIMRGYRKLKQSGNLGKIAEIKRVLTNTPIIDGKGANTSVIFGSGSSNAELVIRQYLLIRVAGIGLNKALLYAEGNYNSKIIYPLPSEWRFVLKQYGFNIAVIRSSLMWYGYSLLLLSYGCMSFIKEFSKELLSKIKQKPPELIGKYVYFNALQKENLPTELKGRQSHDIFSWYYENMGHVDTLCHSIKGAEPNIIQKSPIIYTESPVPPLLHSQKLIRFLAWGFIAITISFIDLFRGKWWNAIMLHESVLAARTRIQRPDKLAKDYMFHNSNWIYRPLWTYEAEKSGARILFYFYSTNIERILKSDGSKNINYGWQACNWPNILVWDNGQEDFIRNDIGNSSSKISVVGPIWFSASKQKLDDLPPKAMAIFDVQPVRNSLYQTLGLDFEYYIPIIAKQFLLDIYAILNANDIAMALKRKRKVGSLAHPEYRNLTESLEKKPNYISINPDVAAPDVIEECFAVISAPYTSTALLARAQGKPSAYYDPFSQCQKGDPAAHGIEILSGKKELEKWVNQLVEAM
jgi:polysaccharide biosynthesis PFTS motif protein